MKHLPLSLLLIAVCFGLTLNSAHAQIGKETKQLIVGTAANWDSSYVTLTHYERKLGGGWRKVHSWNGRLGKNGMAWGLGTHGLPPKAKMKVEGDGRSPAGIFDISHGAYGYAATIQKRPSLPYRKITEGSLWYENAKSPYYNSHRQINRAPETEAEKKAQMKQSDAAHSLKLFIAHNAPPKTRPGYGSSIFFHIWRRDGASATAGCTTMSEKNLKAMISHIDPKKNPRYILLPKALYEANRKHWGLP